VVEKWLPGRNMSLDHRRPQYRGWIPVDTMRLKSKLTAENDPSEFNRVFYIILYVFNISSDHRFAVVAWFQSGPCEFTLTLSIADDDDSVFP